jgi:hypothetical protein
VHAQHDCQVARHEGTYATQTDQKPHNSACRNVTITGAQGVDTVLDLDFVAAAVQLCPSCSVTFNNITVANERHGVGEAVDFFSGQRGSSSAAAVLFVDANKLRLACTDAAAAAAVLQEAPRSNGARQQASVQDATFQVSGDEGLWFNSLALNQSRQ